MVCSLGVWLTGHIKNAASFCGLSALRAACLLLSFSQALAVSVDDPTSSTRTSFESAPLNSWDDINKAIDVLCGGLPTPQDDTLSTQHLMNKRTYYTHILEKKGNIINKWHHLTALINPKDPAEMRLPRAIEAYFSDVINNNSTVFLSSKTLNLYNLIEGNFPDIQNTSVLPSLYLKALDDFTFKDKQGKTIISKKGVYGLAEALLSSNHTVLYITTAFCRRLFFYHSNKLIEVPELKNLSLYLADWIHLAKITKELIANTLKGDLQSLSPVKIPYTMFQILREFMVKMSLTDYKELYENSHFFIPFLYHIDPNTIPEGHYQDLLITFEPLQHRAVYEILLGHFISQKAEEVEKLSRRHDRSSYLFNTLGLSFMTNPHTGHNSFYTKARIPLGYKTPEENIQDYYRIIEDALSDALSVFNLIKNSQGTESFPKNIGAKNNQNNKKARLTLKRQEKERKAKEEQERKAAEKERIRQENAEARRKAEADKQALAAQKKAEQKAKNLELAKKKEEEQRLRQEEKIRRIKEKKEARKVRKQQERSSIQALEVESTDQESSKPADSQAIEVATPAASLSTVELRAEELNHQPAESQAVEAISQPAESIDGSSSAFFTPQVPPAPVSAPFYSQPNGRNGNFLAVSSPIERLNALNATIFLHLSGSLSLGPQGFSREVDRMLQNYFSDFKEQNFLIEGLKKTHPLHMKVWEKNIEENRKAVAYIQKMFMNVLDIRQVAYLFAWYNMTIENMRGIANAVLEEAQKP